MPRHRHNRVREIIWGIVLFTANILISAFGQIITHLPVFALLAAIPLAYVIGVKREKLRHRARIETLVNLNAEYGRVFSGDAVSAYPPDVAPDHLERSRLLDDPRSGAHRYGEQW